MAIEIEDPTATEAEKYTVVMQALARTIHSNKDLTRSLKVARPDFREALYEGVKPYLKFKPLSFLLVKPH